MHLALLYLKLRSSLLIVLSGNGNHSMKRSSAKIIEEPVCEDNVDHFAFFGHGYKVDVVGVQPSVK